MHCHVVFGFCEFAQKTPGINGEKKHAPAPGGRMTVSLLCRKFLQRRDTRIYAALYIGIIKLQSSFKNIYTVEARLKVSVCVVGENSTS